MKKQIPAILLAIVCAILAIAYINATQTIKELRQAQAETATLSSTKPEGSKETDTIREDAPTSEVSETTTLQAAAEGVADAGEAGQRMMKNIAKMMDNPTMNKVMEASQRGTVGVMYADMIEYLNLNDEETKYFMDLLMYRQMKQVDMAMSMMGGQLTDEEKEALGKDVEEAQEIFKSEMEKFLNSEEDYAEFEYYEKTMSERMMLSQLDQDLTGSGDELSDETYRELLGIMHDERENFNFSSDLTDQENTDISPERFSRQNLQNFANDMNRLNESICSKAQSILSTEQYEAFESSLKGNTELQMSQLEIAAQMFGGE